MCGEVAHSCRAAFWTLGTQMLTAQSLLNTCLRLRSVVCSLTHHTHTHTHTHKRLPQGFSGNVPLLDMSTQCPGTSLHKTHFTRLYRMSVLQVKNAGMRRSGYESYIGQTGCIRKSYTYLCKINNSIGIRFASHIRKEMRQ